MSVWVEPVRLIPPQYKYPAIALCALLWTAAIAGGAWVQGGKSARLECAQAQLEALQEAQQSLLDAQQQAAEANEALRRELAKPPVSKTIREVLSANPSDCRVDPAVADSVQDAIREANRRASK